jgi:uncharacterized protein (DUF302 family)
MTASRNITMSRQVDVPYADAIARIKAALKDEGFGILTEIDVRDTLKQKISVDFRPYTILGACNPQLAYRALETALDVGALLPCNVIVYDDLQDGAVISIFDPETGMSVMGIPDLDPIAAEARARLQRALAAV